MTKGRQTCTSTSLGAAEAQMTSDLLRGFQWGKNFLRGKKNVLMDLLTGAWLVRTT